MLEFQGKYIGYKILSNGNYEISFEADKGQAQKIIRNGIQDTVLDLSVKKHREKRSLEANRYMWLLCGKLAEKLNTTDVEIYRHHIREVGVKFQEKMTVKLYAKMSIVWSLLGKGWLSERVDFGDNEEEGLYNFYYGSSRYNTKQMSRLIDSIVEDCKEQGIETLPPEQIKGMVEAWGTIK